MNKTLIAKNNDVNRSLFKYLVIMLNNVPISRIEKLFRLKDIKVNGIRTNDKQYKLKLGDEIIVYGLNDLFKENVESKVEINFSVIYEDKNLLIIDKAKNVAIHSEENCLNEQVLKYLNYKKNSSFVPSSIGRLDKKTSGLILYAKNYKTLVEFEEKQKYFDKVYQFVSDYNIPDKKIVTVRIKKDITNEKMVVDSKFGVQAKTAFWIDGNRKYAQILTGKKHQIRVTLQNIGFPILGDTKYGGKRARRMFLHSYSITFHNLSEDFSEYNEQIFICSPHW